jgi:hypothetical protein
LFGVFFDTWLVDWKKGRGGAVGLYDKIWIELYYEEIILSLGVGIRGD